MLIPLSNSKRKSFSYLLFDMLIDIQYRITRAITRPIFTLCRRLPLVETHVVKTVTPGHPFSLGFVKIRKGVKMGIV